MQLTEIAAQNFERHLRNNPYPGRGLVIGRSSHEGAWYILYWIMGRSEQSRNRRFVVENNALKTEPVDVSLVADPSLIIYEAMLELTGRYLVGNGNQTRTLYEMLRAGRTFDEAMAQCEREPDAPHYTPRITALLDVRKQPSLTMSILKASKTNSALTDRFTYRPALPPAGFALGLTTYGGDGNPLPSFSGDPLLLPCQGQISEVLTKYWNALNSENRISMALRRIPDHGLAGDITVCNRFG